jgi:TonB family protein
MHLARRGTLASVVLLAAVAGSSRAGAQTAAAQAAATQAAACVADTTPRDTVRQVFYFTRLPRREWPRDAQAAEAQDERALLFAQKMAPYFRAPANVVTAAPGVMVVDGSLALVVTSAGRVDSAEIAVRTRAPTLDSALLAAVRRADSAGVFRDLAPAPGATDTIELRISADTAAPAGTVPLFRAQTVRRGLDDPASIVHMPQPSYPTTALARGIGDKIVLQFVIGVDGKPEPASLRFVDGRYREFAEAARDAVLRATFKPGMVGDCPVRQLVELPISFSADSH